MILNPFIYQTGGGGSGPILLVTVTPVTATAVTATKNGQSVSLSYDSTLGKWWAALPSTGTWTVTATKGVLSASDTVITSETAIYSVSIEFTPIPLIPAMTGNTTPSGVCSASSLHLSTEQPWCTFRDHSITQEKSRNAWASSAAPAWLQYSFENPVIVSSVWLSSLGSNLNNNEVKNFKLQYSLDGSTWVDATSTLTFATTNPFNSEISYPVNNIESQHWRWYCINNVKGDSIIRINCAQLYGYNPN